MTNRPYIDVLVAEDNPTDVLLLREAISNTNGAHFDLTCVGSLEEACNKLRERDFDIVLVDLGLPDSSGMTTFSAILNQAPKTPIVVLTALDDEEIGLKAVQQGAQDYLVKSNAQISFLGRLVLYAVERVRLQKQLEERQESERQDREVSFISRLSDGAVTASGLGLRDRAPDVFREFAERYVVVLQSSVDERLYEVAPDKTAQLRRMAGELCYLGAGARDIVELHSMTLKRCIESVPFFRKEVYLEEGRVTVLALMGYLVECYREQYSG